MLIVVFFLLGYLLIRVPLVGFLVLGIFLLRRAGHRPRGQAYFRLRNS